MSYQEERLQEIADAIREVKGTTEKIPATNFASEIVGLSVVKPSGIKTITENGDYDVSNYAWASVNVEADLNERVIIGKWVDEADGGILVYEFKENGICLFNGFEGTYTILGNTIQAQMILELPDIEPQTITFVFTYNRDADTLVRVGDDGLEYVSTRVGTTLITKEITENGTYKASDDGADGYSEVVVNVASGGGDSTPKIYGVSWVNDASTTMTRTDDAVGMSYSISNGRVTSDFDKVFPYNQMKRTVINGNTFVFVPAMWFRVVADVNKKITSIAVSSVKGEGDDWYPTRPFYYGAYGASSDGTVLKSVSGASRTYTITRATARQRAMTVGTNYHQRDLYAGTILMFLWWIEFANKNSASVMTGASYGNTTGNTDTIYNEEAGENFCVSGYDTSTQQMVWRGIEDYVGNGYEWEDGVTGNGTSGGEQYVSDDYKLYDDYSGGSQMSALTFNSPTTTGGCLEALGWDETKPFLCQPIATRSDSNYVSGFCDNASTKNNIVSCRGCENPTYAFYGVSCFNRLSVSYSGINIGCRLMLRI